ncbi:MAG: thymidine phosphorylase family protein [Cyclobacteriaceae bacterium]|jgi:thymidine phosphorylase|nr:thymidine phosphorylase family protein [Cyclobacteriaceae bacterium]
MEPNHSNNLKVKSIGIDTYRENTIYMRHDCHVCVAEGFTALTRVIVSCGGKQIIATLNVIHNSNLLEHGEAALSMEAMERLNVKEGDFIGVSHLPPVESLRSVRAKLYGQSLEPEAYQDIIRDITDGKYSNIELATFIAACSNDRLKTEEIIYLTKAMIHSGQKLSWPGIVVDKHCVGGLPGNRTTPIVVSIIAAAGLTIPKTSSRAITSPAGTADTVETFTNANLDLIAIRKVVEQEGGCMAWGGAVKLSPADDILISIERSLDLDSPAQLIASVLSKKAAAGSTHVVIDIPVGKSAKVRTMEEAVHVKDLMMSVAAAINMTLDVVFTDGQQPVGRGIGPALEALDIIAVLKGNKEAPIDLRDRSLKLAGRLLEMTGKTSSNGGYQMAFSILEKGEAWKKFQAICQAQGRFTEPTVGQFRYEVISNKDGVVANIDNRKLAKLAKLCGAPHAPGAGILFMSPLYKKISKGDVLLILFAQSKGELEYAKEYLKSSPETILQIV